uniref:Uncharacterized protein LOC114348827 n=1 Tax=Diabrotica virgifera virgifera TaxID=50390 RepID=A0A6P7GZD9_DIAVI
MNNSKQPKPRTTTLQQPTSSNSLTLDNSNTTTRGKKAYLCSKSLLHGERLVVKSTLNPNADDWSESLLRREMLVAKSTLNPNADEWYPKCDYYLIHLQDLKRIRLIIKTLTDCPGQFKHLIQILMKSLKPYHNRYSVMPSLVGDIIVEQVSR